MFFFAIIAVTPKVNLHNLMIHTHTKIGPRIVLSRSKSHMGMFSRLLWTVQAQKVVALISLSFFCRVTALGLCYVFSHLDRPITSLLVDGISLLPFLLFHSSCESAPWVISQPERGSGISWGPVCYPLSLRYLCHLSFRNSHLPPLPCVKLVIGELILSWGL